MRTRILCTLVLICIAGCAADRHGDDEPGASRDAEDGFTRIFNGRDLAGWTYGTSRGVPRKAGNGYQVRPAAAASEAVLYCTATDGGNLLTETEYANFILRFDFKLTPGANNGIAIRSPLEGNAASEGIEIQVLDDTAEKYAKLRPTQYHGSVYDVFPARRGHLKPLGEWNTQEIIADGPKIKVTLNGQRIVDADLDDVTDPATLKKHPGLKRQRGHIGFMGHGTAVEFRNIRVRPLR